VKQRGKWGIRKVEEEREWKELEGREGTEEGKGE